MATSSWGLLKDLGPEEKFNAGKLLGELMAKEQAAMEEAENLPAQVQKPPTMRPKMPGQQVSNPQAVMNMENVQADSQPLADIPAWKTLGDKNELVSEAAKIANKFKAESDDPTISDLLTEAEKERIRKLKEQLNLLYTPEFVSETTDKFLSEGGPLYEDKKGIDDQVELVKTLLSQPQQVDLSSMMGMADYLGKTNTARSGYTPPKNIQAQDVLGFYGDLQKQRRDLRKSALDYFKNLKAGTSTDETTEKLMEAIRNRLQSRNPKLNPSGSGLAGTKFDWQLDETLRKESDKAMEEITDFRDNLFKMETSLAAVLKGDEASGAMLRSQLISFLKTLNKEVGNTAVQEQLSQISPSLKGTEQSITAWFNAGQFKDDPKRSQHLVKLVDFARRNMVDVETKKLNNKLSNFKKSAPLVGKDVDKWFEGPRSELTNIKENSPLSVARKQKRDAIIKKIQDKPESERTPKEKEVWEALKKKGLVK